MTYIQRTLQDRTVLIPVLLCIFQLSACERNNRNIELDRYLYRDTKDLVRFVYDASRILEKKGIKGVEELRENRFRYRTATFYLYVYSLDGTNIFHAGMPEFEGKNLMDVTDRSGKRIMELILRAIDNPVNPHGWVHYSWWEPGKFYLVPKSSCHFKVTGPDGSEFIVGGGIDYPPEEKEFIRIAVDDAIGILDTRGRPALDEIEDPVNEYNYRDVRVFVFQGDGTILVSPVVDEQFQNLALLDCIDEVGHRPFRKALERLKNKEYTWEVFLARTRGERGLIKKSLYLRRTRFEGKETFVGAVTDLPQPP